MNEILSDAANFEDSPYQLVSSLGQGGMGQVYLAKHRTLERFVVIKILREDLKKDSTLEARLRREARILGQLKHPSIVEVFDYSVAKDGRPFLVMEYVDGVSVRDLLKALGPLSPYRTCVWLRQIVEGLAVAHQKEVIHRDLKPDNLYVTRDGNIKILDFGIAKSLSMAPHLTYQTAFGMTLGTFHYMAPEQILGQVVSAPTDFYALGCVAYEMLSGKTPFHGPDLQALYLQHIGLPVEPLRTSIAIPEALDQLLLNTLEKKSIQRPQSAEVIKYTLDVLLHNGTCVESKNETEKILRFIHDTITERSIAMDSNADKLGEIKSLHPFITKKPILKTMAILLAIMAIPTSVWFWVRSQKHSNRNIPSAKNSENASLTIQADHDSKNMPVHSVHSAASSTNDMPTLASEPVEKSSATTSGLPPNTKRIQGTQKLVSPVSSQEASAASATDISELPTSPDTANSTKSAPSTNLLGNRK